MQVQIIGITKEMKRSKENPNKEFFIVIAGYPRDDMDGLQTRNIFLTKEMIAKAGGYVPKVNDVCTVNISFGGYVDSLVPVK